MSAGVSALIFPLRNLAISFRTLNIGRFSDGGGESSRKSINFATDTINNCNYEQDQFSQNYRYRPGRALGRGSRGTIHFDTSSSADSENAPCHHVKHPAAMSILKKNFGRRQDAIITDCFVVMPDGVTDADGNRRYCKIENAAWDTGQPIRLSRQRLSPLWA